MGVWFQPPNYLEFLLLRQLAEERNKHELEQIEKNQHKRTDGR